MNGLIFMLQPADRIAGIHGLFYVIEQFPFPQFVIDENGNLKTFDTYREAKQEADDCQQGHVLTFMR